jgi:hypothetical protein
MRPIDGRAGLLGRLSLAAALLGATALGVASAAPLGPQPGLDADHSLVTQVKKGKHNHGHRRWLGVGAVIVLGAGYCTAQAVRCEERYGADGWRYWRCLRRVGCD